MLRRVNLCTPKMWLSTKIHSPKSPSGSLGYTNNPQWSWGAFLQSSIKSELRFKGACFQFCPCLAWIFWICLRPELHLCFCLTLTRHSFSRTLFCHQLPLLIRLKCCGTVLGVVTTQPASWPPSACHSWFLLLPDNHTLKATTLLSTHRAER